MKYLAWLLLPVSCALQVEPVVPPPDDGGSCPEAMTNIEKLGGCGQDLSTFVTDCEHKVRQYASVGDRFPVGCLSASASCLQAKECR